VYAIKPQGGEYLQRKNSKYRFSRIFKLLTEPTNALSKTR